MDGAPASDEAIEGMRKSFGIDISSHRSRNVKDVSVNDFIDFDYVVAMTKRLASHLKSVYPNISAKLIPWNIADPYGKEAAVYEGCGREIRKNVEELPAYLKEKNRKK